MIKYYHELTKAKLRELAKSGMTWGEMAKEYHQPKWCGYPNALAGLLGCWSLTGGLVKNEDYCKDCDCYIVADALEVKTK